MTTLVRSERRRAEDEVVDLEHMCSHEDGKVEHQELSCQ